MSADLGEAARWYRKAAEQGHPNAQINLGVMYANGDGVSQDYAEAVKWYRRAAERGNANAQNSLGVMYARGNGVPLDHIQAYMWFDLAAARADKSAVENRDLVATKMSADQIAEAQRLAREWKPTAGH